MDKLTERERDIIQARRLQDEPATLEELSQKYGVSRERVRQIEVRAFEKLQEAMAAAPDRRARIRTDALIGLRLAFHVAQRFVLAVGLRSPSRVSRIVDNAFVEHAPAVFQIIAQQRQAEQIFGGALAMFAAGGVQRFVPFVQVIGAAAQPGQRHQLGAFIFVQRANRAQQFLAHRIVGLVLQDIGVAVIGGIGALVGIAVAFLHVEFPRLHDDEGQLVGWQCPGWAMSRRWCGAMAVILGNLRIS